MGPTGRAAATVQIEQKWTPAASESRADPGFEFRVNVLVSAMREDTYRHREINAYVERLRRPPEPFGISDLVLCGALGVLTHPRVFVPPTPPQLALEWVAALRNTSNAVVVAPGPRHWGLFTQLLEQTGAIGNLASDAWHAALAIEHGCEFISDNSAFARFPGLRWRRPG